MIYQKHKFEFILLFPLIASRILQIERGSSRSRSLQNSLWKRLWTCSKTDHRMNDELHLQASVLNGFYVNIRTVCCYLYFLF